MKKTTGLLLCILIIVSAFSCARSARQPYRADLSARQTYRADLVALMDQYLAALVKHDPAGIPLASDVKLVENTEVTPIGKGLWETSTGGATTDYKIYVADPVLGQIGFMGLHQENDKPIQLGVRLKLENGEITEIEHMIWRTISDPMPEGLITPRPGLIEPLPDSEKVSRDEMVKASLAYYDAIEQNDGNVAPFANECQRHEGGMASANNQAPLPEGAEATIGSIAMFGRMKCGEQLSTGVMGYITDINQRRVAAVDEEMGLVMIFSMFNHDGEPDPLPIINVPGVTERDNEWGQFNVGAAHIYKIRNGKIYEIEAMASLGMPYQASDGWSCTRKCLADIMDQYLAALASNEPSGAPLSDDVMLVENTEKTPIGEGLWKTATGGPTDFKIIAADADAGEVAFMGVVEENEKPTIAAIRLKVVDHQIKEIDHLVIHNEEGTPLNPNMSKVRPALLERQPKLERIPRKRMVEIANSYYESILQGNGDVAPFADECQRRENGGISANDQTQTPEEAAKDDFSVFRKMKCGEQMNTGMWRYITDISDRRILAIDKEKGLAFAFSIFRHVGEPKVMKIIGVPGVTERPNDYGPFDLPAAHIFKIRDGKIYDIEAIGYMADHGITNGWEQPLSAAEPEWDPGSIKECDRQCLIDIIDGYMDAIFKSDPEAVPPLAMDVRMTENTGVMDVGEGVLWRFKTEPTEFKIYVADPVAGQVAQQARLKIGGRDALVAVRLKVDRGKIQEIEHLYDREIDKAAIPLLTTPVPVLTTDIPPEERLSRELLFRVANTYFDALEGDNGKIGAFSDDCVRHENGYQTVNNPPPGGRMMPAPFIPTADTEMGREMLRFSMLTCEEQINEKTFAHMTRIRPRRALIIDEQKGIVGTFPLFVHDGTRRGAPDAPPGMLLNLVTMEIFGIRNGLIQHVEALPFVTLPYALGNGWTIGSGR